VSVINRCQEYEVARQEEADSKDEKNNQEVGHDWFRSGLPSGRINH
jgi:hypothetical protein